MKKITIDQRLRWKLVSEERWARRLKRKKRKLLGRRLALLSAGKKLVAPRVVSLESTDDCRHDLLTFIEQLRKRVVIEKKPFIIDFSRTERLAAGGTLLLYAELRRSLHLIGNTIKIYCHPSKNNKVNQAFKQIGLLDLLNYKKTIKTTHADVIHWRYAMGMNVDGSKYENILGSYEGKVADALLDKLFRGISEAMTNCHHHAYLLNREDGIPIKSPQKNWWMFSQERDGYLTVVFCDLGCGIPRTLPMKRPNVWKRIMSLGKAGSDGEVIRYAIEDSITRTGKHYRGKGLKQLLEAAREQPRGALRIFSNSGCYTYFDGRESVYDYRDSIHGTMIFWKVPLNQGRLI